MAGTTERWLEGRVALVTGGSSGIGAACVEELARRGAAVAINFLSRADEAEALAETCRRHDVEVHALHGDVAEPASVLQLFDAIDAKFGRLDILVANAGIQRDAAFTEMSLEDWRRVLDVNLTGQFLCAQAAVRRFLAQPRNAGYSAGNIVHMSSVHDSIPWAGHVNYAASKAGVTMLARSLALELAANGVRVNVVSPGAIRTPLNRGVWADEAKARELLNLIPNGRIGAPREVAAAVAWLVSDAADYITGETLYIDGGMRLYPGFLDNG
ncbi:MAG TPA: 3-oxoacyl-ACP reductase FabG [Woeseiaceae bacterium]|nr:3-oxoacyl-ACP reductase FabG [Woeseiaceae bacterium]